jgi:hypothetical protein
MSGFIKGEDRFQATLFPERLDDYVAEDSAVRVILHCRSRKGCPSIVTRKQHVTGPT